MGRPPDPVARIAGSIGGVSGRDRGRPPAPRPAGGRTTQPTTPPEHTARSVLILLALLLSAAAVRAEPTIGTSSDGKGTVTWSIDDPTLVLENVTAEGRLAWRTRTLAWSGGDAFADNGTVAPELEAIAGGLEIKADPRNHLASGDFSVESPWTFSDDPGGQVTAAWSGTGTAVVSHTEPASPRVQWESFDTEVNWDVAASLGGGSDPSTVHQNQQEGTGMMKDVITTGTAPDSWAGVSRTGSFDWSPYDRLLIWIYAPANVVVSFNVTALMGSDLQGTVAQPLSQGWQELLLDLSPLGPGRVAISQVTLRFIGQGLSQETFHLDDLRLLRAKQVRGMGVVSQTLEKMGETSARWGSAILGFRWQIVNADGLSSVRIGMNLTGPSSEFATWLDATAAGEGQVLSADVSPWTMDRGTYELRLWAQMTANTTELTAGTVLIDDASLRFPQRQNGTFVSRPIDFGGRVEAEALTWEASISASGSIRVGLRAGNSSDPSDGSWGSWWDLTDPGAYPSAIAARSFQVRAEMGTTNASETPRLEMLSIRAGHRAAEGSVTTLLFDPGERFLRWSRLEPEVTLGPAGSAVFEVGNGSAWIRVASDADLFGAPAQIQVRAILRTQDGLESPVISSIRLAHDVPPSFPPVWDWITANVWIVSAALGAAVAYLAYTIAARRTHAIEDVFLVARDGRLIMHNTRRMRAQWDEDMFAGMLTALSAFVRDSFKEDRGYLNRFEFSGKTVLIERIDSMYVAAMYSGQVPRSAPRNLRTFVKDIEDRFGPKLDSWSGSPDDLQDLKELTDRFVGRPRYRPTRSR